jgi:hypothetical protein
MYLHLVSDDSYGIFEACPACRAIDTFTGTRSAIAPRKSLAFPHHHPVPKPLFRVNLAGGRSDVPPAGGFDYESKKRRRRMIGSSTQ